MNLPPCYYAGLDIHKKEIAYCVMAPDGTIYAEDKIGANRRELKAWVASMEVAFFAGVEATIFTSWVYDTLLEEGVPVEVGHPGHLRAIVAGKKKSDRLDAQTLANLLRCNLFPSCYMASSEIRSLRRVLRYRNMVVRQMKQMKNRTAGILMELGQPYDKQKLHRHQYFNQLMEELTPEVSEEACQLLELNRSAQQDLQRRERWLIKKLVQHPELYERVLLLQSIPGVGELTALTWALEVGEPERFPSIKKAVSYCGLCSGHKESAGVIKSGPLSKQRNAHLQSMLIEAAKIAPQHNSELKKVYDRERARGSKPNEATIAVARKLVAYLLSVDKNQRKFEMRESA